MTIGCLLIACTLTSARFGPERGETVAETGG
jgi:hypothetical protein